MTAINPSHLLARTNGGLDIYSYVLAQFYKDPVSLTGGRQLVRNPFTGGRKSLLLEKRGGMLRHQDLARPSFSGTALDFAWLYLKPASREALYVQLDQLLSLQIRVNPDKKVAGFFGKEEPWYPRVSFFKSPISNTTPRMSLDLAQVHTLISDVYLSPITKKLRSLTNLKERRIFKANRFPYVTFSGIFSSRRDQDLVKHSSLVVFDFDMLPNVAEVRHILLHETALETQLLFVSPSGNGLKWVLKIEPENGNHRDFFLSVSNYLWRSFGLKTDGSGRDVSRACFLSFDENSYLHPRHRKESATQGKHLDYSGIWKMN